MTLYPSPHCLSTQEEEEEGDEEEEKGEEEEEEEEKGEEEEEEEETPKAKKGGKKGKKGKKPKVWRERDTLLVSSLSQTNFSCVGRCRQGRQWQGRKRQG